MKVLIVDDEKNIRLTLSGILADEGYDILQAATAENALKVLTDDACDVVLLDIKLPGMDGLALFEILRRDHPDLDVIMISGHSDIETAVKAVKMGAFDFLEKPLSMTRVTIALSQLEDRRRIQNRFADNARDLAERYRMIGNSPAFHEIERLVNRVAVTDAKVLIQGESGTGKELVAFAIHQQSGRRGGPFVRFNSAALPEELVESELFGYEKGAFTGATQRKAGKIEVAHDGTLFLDEIGDMSPGAQAKILRVLQEGILERVGGTESINVDVRILAATNKDLEEMINQGRFREDLYYRLNVFPIRVPALRERREDIPVLIDHFFDYFSWEMKIPRKQLDARALQLLKSYNFPGNIRELRNLVERLYILSPDETIRHDLVLPQINTSRKVEMEFEFLRTQHFSDARQKFDVYYLTKHLEQFSGNISQMAQALGMQQPNLSRKLKDLGIRKP